MISLIGDNALRDENTLQNLDFLPAVNAYFFRLVVFATFDAVCLLFPYIAPIKYHF